MKLVKDLRRMTAVGEAQYEVDGTAFWGDEDLEGAISRHVVSRLLQAEVELIATMSPASALVFMNGRATFAGMLDVETAEVTRYTGGAIAGTAVVHSDGRIEFSENQATAIPVLSGLCYDLNAAAADVLTEWASALKLGYDIKSGDASLPRSQRHEMLLEQAEAFRSKAVAGTAQMGRTDVRPGHRGSRRIEAVQKSFRRLGRPG
jgi:hypothetical protein